MSRSVFGAAFDRVVVINLDRRPDRMSSVREQLNALSVSYTRSPAIDGKDPNVVKEWQAYYGDKVASLNESRNVENWRDFYLGDKPHAARVAFFETEQGKRGISTPGAWGLFRSMRRVIEKAVADKVEKLLILEDDVIFHKDTIDLWPKICSELPDDWQIFQLGAMQLHWEENWISWHSQHLYKCQGSSFAAHALALRSEAMRAVLDRSKVMDMPFDIGPVQEVKRLYRDQCYTAYPNLVIQDAKDTEIGMSNIFEREAKKENNLYRWNWSEYGPSVLRAFQKPAGQNEASPNSSIPEFAFLQPYIAKPNSAERVMVVFGPENEAEAATFFTLLQRQKESGEIAPIVLIHDLVHVPALRAAELAFEYIPLPEAYIDVLRTDRDPTLVVARRLSVLRRKWLPRRIIAFGTMGHARLEAWRTSPFERAELGADLASDEMFPGASE